MTSTPSTLSYALCYDLDNQFIWILIARVWAYSWSLRPIICCVHGPFYHREKYQGRIPHELLSSALLSSLPLMKARRSGITIWGNFPLFRRATNLDEAFLYAKRRCGRHSHQTFSIVCKADALDSFWLPSCSPHLASAWIVQRSHRNSSLGSSHFSSLHHFWLIIWNLSKSNLWTLI